MLFPISVFVASTVGPLLKGHSDRRPSSFIPLSPATLQAVQLSQPDGFFPPAVQYAGCFIQSVRPLKVLANVLQILCGYQKMIVVYCQ